jgi:ubiquinone/menaquinone biosynthesis C-methylase UbiE
MQWTGERMIADSTMGKGAVEHLHRYAIIQSFITGKVVLDLASGEGYGSNLIAHHASFAYGVDISLEAVEHANKKYKKDNLSFLVGSATNIPLENNSVDVIVSFETLEHHTQHEEMMQEFRRVMKQDAVLIISTPEKENYKKIDPHNPYHQRELTFHEFENLLKRHFCNIHLYHQRFFDVSFIYPSSGLIEKIDEFSGDFNRVRRLPFQGNHLFNIAVCSNDKSVRLDIKPSFFNAGEYWQKSREEMGKLNEIRISKAVRAIRQSNSYRLGNFLLLPFSLVKRWMRI